MSYNGNLITNADFSFVASKIYTFTYDGTYWVWVSHGVDNNTTYSSQAAASGGTAVSLVTTGEKYTWNNKSNLTLGTTSTTAAYGNHLYHYWTTNQYYNDSYSGEKNWRMMTESVLADTLRWKAGTIANKEYTIR